MDFVSLGKKTYGTLRATLARPRVRRILWGFGAVALATAAVLLWNTYLVARAGGWFDFARTAPAYKPIVAYPGYTAIPQTFWALASFAVFYALGYWIADGRWSAPLALLRFPLTLGGRLKAGGRFGAGALFAGLALGLYFGQHAMHWTAGALGLALLLLAASRYAVFLAVLVSLAWGYAGRLMSRDVPSPFFKPAYSALALAGAGLGCLGLFVAGLNLPVWTLAALAAGAALLFCADPRARRLLALGGGASVLLGLLEAATALADDAGFYEKNMTWDGVRKWSSADDSGRLIDSSWDASRGVLYGGLPGVPAGDTARELESEEPDDDLAERTYREMMGGTPTGRPPAAPADSPRAGRPPFDRALGEPGAGEER